MVLLFVFLFRLSFCNLPHLFRSRIQFVEDIRRKLFAQYRPVGNDTFVMVNESHAIDSADRVDAKDRVDVLRFEQLPKLVPCIVRTHSIFDRLPQLVECAFFFQFYFRVFIIPLKGFITYIFPYFARFERRADSISVVGQGTVDNPRIISAVDSSRTFFDRNIEAFQQRAKLSVCLLYTSPSPRD